MLSSSCVACYRGLTTASRVHSCTCSGDVGQFAAPRPQLLLGFQCQHGSPSAAGLAGFLVEARRSVSLQEVADGVKDGRSGERESTMLDGTELVKYGG